MTCSLRSQTLRHILSVPSRPVLYHSTRLRSRHCRRHQSDQSLVATSAKAFLPDRTLIHISGRDAPKFLQGLTTNNVDISQENGSYTAFLNATGRVLTDAFLWPIFSKADGEWSCLIDVETSDVTQRLESYLKKHRLRSKVQIKRLEGYQIWAAWLQEKSLEQPEYKMPKLEDQTIKTWGHLPDPRIPGFSHRFILPLQFDPVDGNLGTGLSDTFLKLPSASKLQYNLRRFLNGIPEGSTEMYSEHYQAHTTNLDILNAVDFHKGCYVGQELTIRTEHTGVVRKRILPVQLYSGDSPTPTSLSFSPDVQSASNNAASIPPLTKILSTGGKREAGKWITGIGSVGLAMCRLETMTDLKVSAEGGTYSESAEFFIQPEDASGLKVKAFVPNWLRDRLSSKPRKPRG